jgi:hypothetical protein
VEESASPLKAVESDFAVDSSGFSSCMFERWYDVKWGKMRSEYQWVKAHLMTGVTTNIVTSVEVTAPESNDCPHLAPLLEATAKRCPVAEVSADKAYLSKRNLEVIVNAGAVPYIPFKSKHDRRRPGTVAQDVSFFSVESTRIPGELPQAVERTVPPLL